MRVVHRGAYALFLVVGGWFVGALDQHVTQIPCALNARTGELAAMGVGTADVRDGVLHLSGVPLVIGRLRHWVSTACLAALPLSLRSGRPSAGT